MNWLDLVQQLKEGADYATRPERLVDPQFQQDWGAYSVLPAVPQLVRGIFEADAAISQGGAGSAYGNSPLAQMNPVIVPGAPPIPLFQPAFWHNLAQTVQRAQEVGGGQALQENQAAYQAAPERQMGQKFLLETAFSPLNAIGNLPAGTAKTLTNAPRLVRGLAQADEAYSRGISEGIKGVGHAVQQVPGVKQATGLLESAQAQQTLNQVADLLPGLRQKTGAASGAQVLVHGTDMGPLPPEARAVLTHLETTDPQRLKHYRSQAEGGLRILAGIRKRLTDTFADVDLPLVGGQQRRIFDTLAAAEKHAGATGAELLTQAREYARVSGVPRTAAEVVSGGPSRVSVPTGELKYAVETTTDARNALTYLQDARTPDLDPAQRLAQQDAVQLALLTEQYGDTIPWARGGTSRNVDAAVLVRLQREQAPPAAPGAPPAAPTSPPPAAPAPAPDPLGLGALDANPPAPPRPPGAGAAGPAPDVAVVPWGPQSAMYMDEARFPRAPGVGDVADPSVPHGPGSNAPYRWVRINGGWAEVGETVHYLLPDGRAVPAKIRAIGAGQHVPFHVEFEFPGTDVGPVLGASAHAAGPVAGQTNANRLRRMDAPAPPLGGNQGPSGSPGTAAPPAPMNPIAGQTRAEWLAQAPRASRAYGEATLDKVLAGVRQPDGPPGISVEGEWVPALQTYVEGFTNIVYRTADGQPVGVLKVIADLPGEPGSLNVAVDPAYQRQGIASALYEAAAKAGVAVDRLTGQGGYTDAGASLAHRRAVTAATAQGQPVPPHVLAEYPDLAAQSAPLPPVAPEPPVAGLAPETAPPALPPTRQAVQDVLRAMLTAEGAGATDAERAAGIAAAQAAGIPEPLAAGLRNAARSLQIVTRESTDATEIQAARQAFDAAKQAVQDHLQPAAPDLLPGLLGAVPDLQAAARQSTETAGLLDELGATPATLQMASSRLGLDRTKTVLDQLEADRKLWTAHAGRYKLGADWTRRIDQVRQQNRQHATQLTEIKNRYGGLDLAKTDADDLATAAMAREHALSHNNPALTRLLDTLPVKAWNTLLQGWRQQALFAPAYHVLNITDATFKSLLYMGNTGFLEGANPLNPRQGWRMLKQAWRTGGGEAAERPAIAKLWEQKHQASIPYAQLGVGQSTELASGKALEAAPGVGRLFRANHALGRAIEASARTAAYMHAFEKALKAGKTARIAQQEGLDFAHKLHFDYNALTPIDQVLKQVSGFHIFATRNLPLYAEILATHPGLFRAFKAYDDASEEYQKGVGAEKSQRLEGAIPLGGFGQFFAGTLFGLRGDLFFNPSRYFSIMGQAFGEPNLEQAGMTGVGQALNTAAQGGVGLNPFARLPLQAAGVFGNAQPSPMLRLEPLVTSLVQSITGRQTELPTTSIQRGRWDGLAQALGQPDAGPAPRGLGERVNMRVAEQALEAGRNPNADPATLQAYREGAGNPTWDAAARNQGWTSTMERLAAIFGVPLVTRGATTTAIAQAQAGIPQVTAQGGRGRFEPTLPFPNVSARAPLVTSADRDRLLAERAQSQPLALAYQEARRPAPGGERRPGQLDRVRQQVVAEYLSATPERRQAILANPLHAALIYEYHADPAARRRFQAAR